MDTRKSAQQEIRGVNRRSFFTGLLAGAGVAGIALAGSKAQAADPASVQKASGPVLYHRTEDVDRYFKTMF
ncbi:MAG: hypothetical protein OEW39_00610 [Deltaproteobacteria bacterium]|nr:hypothetical protein [Deltaproteobacteria bacterium]